MLVLICDVHSFATVQALSNTSGAQGTDLESTENKWKTECEKELKEINRNIDTTSH